jgi:hypothetical protein
VPIVTSGETGSFHDVRLDGPFLRLPIRFDAEALAGEVRALPPEAWVAHPAGFVGNEAVQLITPGGGLTDDVDGPRGATDYLKSCPYVQQILAAIGGVWGRSRFMALGAGAEVPVHVDVHYYWRTHLRIHIPVITNPGVHFDCGDETVHMQPGECWVFDSFRRHGVRNQGDARRVHLVIDTVGGGHVPSLLDQARSGAVVDAPFLKPDERAPRGIAFERVNSPKVMSPWEIRCHLALIAEHTTPHPQLNSVTTLLENFTDNWAALWARYGTDDEGMPVYGQLLQHVRQSLKQIGGQAIVLDNQTPLYQALEQLIFSMCLATPEARSTDPFARKSATTAPPAVGSPVRDRFERPIFVVSTPRSGSTLFFETLQQAPGLHSIGAESHEAIEDIPALTPASHDWSSNRLLAGDASPAASEMLARNFWTRLRDRDGTPPDGPVRMIEKTPKNALRIPFFDAIWPDSQFVYLYRDVRQTLYSMMEAWASGGFRTYPRLPGWTGTPWSLLLVPGWRQLNGAPLPVIVANQWAVTTTLMLDDLEALDPSRLKAVDYARFLEQPQACAKAVAESLDLDWDRTLGEQLPLSRYTVSEPNAEKWRRLESVIEGVMPIVRDADERARRFLDRHSVLPKLEFAPSQARK